MLNAKRHCIPHAFLDLAPVTLWVVVPGGHLVQDAAFVSELKESAGQDSQAFPLFPFKKAPLGQTERQSAILRNNSLILLRPETLYLVYRTFIKANAAKENLDACMCVANCVNEPHFGAELFWLLSTSKTGLFCQIDTYYTSWLLFAHVDFQCWFLQDTHCR